uniref:type VI lipase adapter Tla3 domain-containing protein n=1 Tax=Iodobacter sp. TaxID=1915058 RepID=UPI0025F59F39
MSLRRIALPRLWPWLLLLLASLTIWIVVLETIIRPSAISLESTPMLLRLSWWFLPPLIFIFSLFTGQWALGSAKAEAAELKQQQESELLQRATAAKASEAAKAKSQQQFSLEIRSVGITVERFRQMAIWKQLDKTNHPLKSMLSQNPDDYEWAGETRDLQTDKRANNAFENALRLWVERWPIPVLVADSTGMGINSIRWAQNGSGLSIHMFTALGAHQGEGSDKLVQQAFQYFDDNPELPAILLLSVSTAELKDRMKDARFVPNQPDSIVAILLTRSDRVDQYLRPYAVDVPYNINMDKTQYDIIKLWNFYWDQKDTYRTSIPKSFDTMPTDYWNGEVKKLISQIDP